MKPHTPLKGLKRFLKLPLIASGIAILVCLFSQLGALGLVGPDEPRYVWIARAMAETGDWITPRLYGQPWFEKPALYYWLAGFGFLLHLPAEWAARLPSAIAALAAAVAIAWLGWRYYGADDGTLEEGATLLAPLLFSTTVAAIAFARAATPDMVFSALITLAMASVAYILEYSGALRAVSSSSESGRSRIAPLLLFGMFLGLAVLAKGPAAVALAGGSLLLWVVATREWRAALRLMYPWAIAAFCLVALPWYVVCARRNPDFIRVFILQHNFERYLTPIFEHRQPFWFFGPIILLALLPWTVLLWPSVVGAVCLLRQSSWQKSPELFFACWFASPLIFFSFSQSKLPSYILPAIPPLTLLCALALGRLQTAQTHMALVGGGIALTWLGVAIFALHSLHRIQRMNQDSGTQLLHAGYPIVLLAVTIAAVVSVAGFRCKPRGLAIICAICVATTVEGASLFTLPVLDQFVSARPHAEFLRNDRRPDRVFTYHLRRDWNWGLAFYFHRELPEWSPSDPEAALVLTTPTGLAEIRKLHRFEGSLDEPYAGIVYVPINQAPR